MTLEQFRAELESAGIKLDGTEHYVGRPGGFTVQDKPYNDDPQWSVEWSRDQMWHGKSDGVDDHWLIQFQGPGSCFSDLDDYYGKPIFARAPTLPAAMKVFRTEMAELRAAVGRCCSVMGGGEP
jgi:hypothetical protein